MRHLEDDMQAACVKWFSYQYQELKRLLVHIPNGGNRNLREAVRLKKAGVISGAPDLVLFIPKNGYSVLCIEMKAGDKGKQSELQRSWQELAEKHGNKYVIVRSFDEFRSAIQSYLSQKL